MSSAPSGRACRDLLSSSAPLVRADIGTVELEEAGRFADRFRGQELEVALEATTGWRFVVEELRRVAATVHLAEPPRRESSLPSNLGQQVPSLADRILARLRGNLKSKQHLTLLGTFHQLRVDLEILRGVTRGAARATASFLVRLEREMNLPPPSVLGTFGWSVLLSLPISSFDRKVREKDSMQWRKWPRAPDGG